MNYESVFILVADDCPATEGILLQAKAGKAKPIHLLQYELLSQSPYRYTQEDILFLVHAERNQLSKTNKDIRRQFFEKKHPCLRSSALGKKYGWGIHFDETDKAAIYAKGSSEYKHYAESNALKIIKAMRNKRA